MWLDVLHAVAMNVLFVGPTCQVVRSDEDHSTMEGCSDSVL